MKNDHKRKRTCIWDQVKTAAKTANTAKARMAGETVQNTATNQQTTMSCAIDCLLFRTTSLKAQHGNRTNLKTAAA